MQVLILLVIIGLSGGVAVGLQSPLANLISVRPGVLESVFIVHLGGTIAAGIPLLVMTGGKLGDFRHLPWYALGAGILGLIVVSAISYTIPRLGLTTTVVLVVAGQLLVGLLIDHYGLLGTAIRPIDLSRLLGIVVVFLGVWLIVR
jgi:transporter family-2 protein